MTDTQQQDADQPYVPSFRSSTTLGGPRPFNDWAHPEVDALLREGKQPPSILMTESFRAISRRPFRPAPGGICKVRRERLGRSLNRIQEAWCRP